MSYMLPDILVGELVFCILFFSHSFFMYYPLNPSLLYVFSRAFAYISGALSQIMACYLADKYPNINVTMIGFGNPRVGNEQFKNWSESLSNLAVWRYVNDDDVVTRIPPQNFDFHHAGHTFQLWSNDDKATVYYRHIGDGVQYEGAPSYWYCK